jgi:hypothetical protein
MLHPPSRYGPLALIGVATLLLAARACRGASERDISSSKMHTNGASQTIELHHLNIIYIKFSLCTFILEHLTI